MLLSSSPDDSLSGGGLLSCCAAVCLGICSAATMSTLILHTGQEHTDTADPHTQSTNSNTPAPLVWSGVTQTSHNYARYCDTLHVRSRVSTSAASTSPTDHAKVSVECASSECRRRQSRFRPQQVTQHTHSLAPDKHTQTGLRRRKTAGTRTHSTTSVFLFLKCL